MLAGLFSSREEDRPSLRARSAAALDRVSRESIKLADYIARALARVLHKAFQTPCAGTILQYVTDAG
jgi:hypothetical protein